MSQHPIFNLGFRIFFAGACFFSALSILVWLLYFNGFIQISFTHLSPLTWHGHEMIFGYSVAVIAGFLLTAVRNWTGLNLPQGAELKYLFLTWLGARLCWLFGFWWFGHGALVPAAFLDTLFLVWLLFAISRPIIQRKQWRQSAVVSKVLIILMANTLFYAQALGLMAGSQQILLYLGLYIVVGLILTIGRRIMPLFIERGVDYEVSLFNARWVDITSLSAFLIFTLSALFSDWLWLSQSAAWVMVGITSIRLVGWHTPGAWRKPLLWCFYATLIAINLGFLSYALEQPLGLSPYISVHAFAYGAIGFITMGMIARVSIGHTGRNIHEPPAIVGLCLGLLLLGVLLRTVFVVLAPGGYLSWINLSGILWILAFALLGRALLPMWLQARPDGKPG